MIQRCEYLAYWVREEHLHQDLGFRAKEGWRLVSVFNRQKSGGMGPQVDVIFERETAEFKAAKAALQPLIVDVRHRAERN